jgi:hypothetical protein
VRERGLDLTTLFATLRAGRRFGHELGCGATNILRLNLYELLGPRSQITGAALAEFLEEKYAIRIENESLTAGNLDSISNISRFVLQRLNADTNNRTSAAGEKIVEVGS